MTELLDAIVIGAGLSGLAAARRLRAAGKRVRVVEARERVGGRSYSVAFPGSSADDIVDLGGQWLGPTQTRALALADELGLSRIRQASAGIGAGARLVDFDGRVRRYRGLLPRIPLFALAELGVVMARLDLMAKRVPRAAPWAAARAAELDGQSLDDWLRAHVRSAGARAMLTIVAEAIFAAHPRELSLLFFLHYVHCGGGLQRLAEVDDGAQMWKLAGGAQQLAAGLADRLTDDAGAEAVVLGEPVAAIEHDADGITIVGARQRHRARRAILAVSPAIAGRIELPGELSAARRRLHERMVMGSTLKALIAYPRAFWREAGLSGEAISDRLRVRLCFDASAPGGGCPRLVAFVFDEHARALGQLDGEARKAAIVADLSAMFGPEAARPSAYLDHDWTADPWSGGCYTGLLAARSFAELGPALREVAGRLHFAGTEAARVWAGYFEGAIESGERAADEVLAALA